MVYLCFIYMFVIVHLCFLLQSCAAPMKRIETFVTGTHNDTWQCYEYSDVVNKFLNEVSTCTAFKCNVKFQFICI